MRIARDEHRVVTGEQRHVVEHPGHWQDLVVAAAAAAAGTAAADVRAQEERRRAARGDVPQPHGRDVVGAVGDRRRARGDRGAGEAAQPAQVGVAARSEDRAGAPADRGRPIEAIAPRREPVDVAADDDRPASQRELEEVRAADPRRHARAQHGAHGSRASAGTAALPAAVTRPARLETRASTTRPRCAVPVRFATTACARRRRRSRAAAGSRLRAEEGARQVAVVAEELPAERRPAGVEPPEDQAGARVGAIAGVADVGLEIARVASYCPTWASRS